MKTMFDQVLSFGKHQRFQLKDLQSLMAKNLKGERIIRSGTVRRQLAENRNKNILGYSNKGKTHG
jgi:hypothetical protein